MIDSYVYALVDYAERNFLISDLDRCYAVNRLIEALGMDEITPCESAKGDLESILARLCDYAFEKGIIKENTTTYRDLFDTKLMGLLTPAPSVVINTFRERYAGSPELATKYYYALSRATDYIRTYRVKKDLKWTVDSDYGAIDITVNLSKPEKDPKAIAAAKLLKQSGYPKCALCPENEGYAGRVNAAARQNHRIIPIELAGKEWFLQYSPYVYYNEHCIALSAEHVPMKIDRSSFEKILDFVDLFPHYFIGSNADLPIVGGSILTHDHMQGGNYSFAMAKAEDEREISFEGYGDVKAAIVKWPMSVIRLTCDSKSRLVELADKILVKWRAYSDPEAYVFASTDGEPHNTITPIGRRVGEAYQLDLVLRNNITTKEHPMGLYHPHSELHNIKKENIGLIEVMGLAVLPARLKAEMEALTEAILENKDISEDEMLSKHKAWLDTFKDKYSFDSSNTFSILQKEIGNTFVKVLEDAGVYKYTAEGRRAFMRFIDAVNEK
ncbi:MAG: UDP-glucose--hexose-1-phosphate uridylyltransferase [Ruminococcaceae bacterium]|nr:UDP-glucose--hexose-1-phosphate uridylyltransferase [Oscillospiraceae bacterium]